MLVIGVLDGGTETIKTEAGHPVNVRKIILRTSTRESEPIDHIGYCRLNYDDAVIKALQIELERLLARADKIN